MKIFKKYIMPALTMIFLIGVMSIATAQEKEKVEKSVELKMSTENDKTRIEIKIRKEDGTYFEKTYSSKEEMANDPELKEFNMEFGEVGNIFKHKSDHDGAGTFEITIDEDGNKSSNVMFFKSMKEAEGDFDIDHVWVQKIDGASGNMVFNSKEGYTYKINKDEEGNYTIEKDGELIDMEDLKGEGNVLFEMKEDGTMVIKDGNKTTEIKMDGSQGGHAFFITEDDVIHEFDGDKMLHFKGESGEENVWFEKSEDGDHEIIFFNSDGEIDEGMIKKMKEMGGSGSIIIKIDSDKGDTHEVHVRKLQKIHIEILDLKNLNEISEIPNIHLNSGSNLKLEEVNYFPNPNSGEFTLRFQAERNPTQIKIVDMMGKEVYYEQINDFQGIYDKNINLSNSEPGLYILQVIQNDKSWSKKLIVE